MAEITFPFATLSELKQRWPDFPAGADDHAEVLLEDASQFIFDVAPSAANAPENTRRRIVCSVVRRSLEAGQTGMAGVESQSWSSGPHSISQSPANPHGDLYLTKAEKLALGEGGRQKAFSVPISGYSGLQHRPWCSLMFGAAYCSCGADLTQDEPLWEG